jgi:hypothetical protein
MITFADAIALAKNSTLQNLQLHAAINIPAAERDALSDAWRTAQKPIANLQLNEAALHTGT